MRRIIAARLASERLEAELESRVAGEPSASDSMLTGEALAAAIDAGVPSAVLVSVGEERLTLRSLESMLALAASRGGAVTPEALVRAFRLRALTYRRAVAEGLTDDPAVEARMARVAERLGTARQIRERLASVVRADERRLEQYFLAHRARFAEPRRLDVERLTLPLNENATEAMADLQGLDVASEVQWRGVAERWGGSIRPLGWLTIEEMARFAPAGAVAGLAASGKAMPFRTETTLELLRVVGRREPEPALFPAARERALDAYLADHGPEEYRRQQESALQGAGFTVDRPALEAMVLRPDATSGNR